MYYISESHALVSTVYDQGSWYPDPSLGIPTSVNYSTAKDTRSLSISSLENGSFTEASSANESFHGKHPTVDLALLYYEDPTGTISALPQQWNLSEFHWADVTSQKVDSLPNESLNVANLVCQSSVLYECNTVGTLTTPFTSAANYSGASVGALFLSPSNTSQVAGGPPGSGGTIVNSRYSIGTGFVEGMYWVSSCFEQSFTS